MEYIDKLEKLKKTEEVEDDINEFYEYDLVQLGKLYGLEEGHEKGKEEGKVETQKEMVHAMIKEGISIDVIKKCTNLSLYDLEKLQSEHEPLTVAEPNSGRE